MIKEFTKKAVKADSTIRFGTGKIGVDQSLLLACEGHIKSVDKVRGRKVYTIENFKWVLYVKDNQIKEEVICEHKDDYELKENDIERIRYEVEKWNNRADILKNMLEGSNSYQETVEKAKRKGGWTYKNESMFNKYYRGGDHAAERIERRIELDRTKLKRVYENVATISSEYTSLNSNEVVHYIGCDFCDFEYGVNISTRSATDKGQFNSCSFGEGLRNLMIEHGVDTLEFKKDGYVVVEDMNITIGALMIISDEK